jgi:gas vesicle protein
MDTETYQRRDYRFALGLLAGTVAGTVVGVGLAAWLAPKAAAELRKQVTDSASRFRTRAAGAIDEFADKGNAVRDEVAGTVARAAHEVERVATAVRSDRR